MVRGVSTMADPAVPEEGPYAAEPAANGPDVRPGDLISKT